MIYKNKIKNIKLWDSIVILSPFLILIFYKITMIFHIPSICIWKLLTGHECIGCGIMRAIVCLLKLDFKGASYSMVKELDSNIMEKGKSSNNKDNIIGKVFGYFSNE